MATIDDIKSIATAKLGFARPNQFLVELPPIGSGGFGGLGGFLGQLLPVPSIPGIVDGGISNTREMNILCAGVNIPGKQVTTIDRRIGMEYQRVASGYAVDDVTMTFYCMNDYGVRKYFDAWVSSAIDEANGGVAYKSEYAKSIKIHQLRKAQVGFSANLGPIRGNLGIGGGTVYAVELIEAFPTTILAQQLNSELDGLVELSVSFSYTRWQPAGGSIQNFVEGGINLGTIFG